MIDTEISNKERFAEACTSFVPQADDNPDCVPFYRAWFGMREVLGKETMDRWHHLFHEAIGFALYKRLSDEETFDAILAQARYMCERGGRTEEPRYSYSWESSPAEPTEKDAREFFNSEYKRAFPGKRANSKHANELWTANCDKALAILMEQYQAKLAQYQERENKRNAENQRKHEEWIGNAETLARFEYLIRELQK